MESIIINGIRHLHVLPNYYNKMDELAKDLNSALEESSDRRSFEKVKRSKAWKYRPRSKAGITFGSNLGKSSTKSDDSESSLDHWIQNQMELSTRGSYQHTDSDSILCKVRKSGYDLATWRQCPSIVAESDSVNENLPMREPRRKRKFKRMSVDPPCGKDNVFSSLSSSGLFSQKNKRLRNLKSQKNSKLAIKSPKFSKCKSVSQLPSKMESIGKSSENLVAASGKRKRCSHERNMECTGCDYKELFSTALKNVSDSLDLKNTSDQLESLMPQPIEFNTCSVSSSESDCGILTNDEGREADDEHSDYFHEPDLTAGLQNFSPWWEDDKLIADEEQTSDEKLQKSLSASFLDDSDHAKSLHSMHVDSYKNERQIRSGRRRLGQSVSVCNNGSDEFCINASLKNDSNNLSTMDGVLTRTTPNEKKKRKGMPSSSLGFNESLAAVPESTIGFQMLKSMSWKPVVSSNRSTDGISSLVSDSRLGLLRRNEDKTLYSSAASFGNI